MSAGASPATNRRFTLLVTPPPTPNGPLHVGHLSGPYLAGDVAARAAAAAGQDVVTLCGLDSHQNYVLAKAEAAGQPALETVDHYAGLIRQALQAARVEYDIFTDPTGDSDYRDAVAALLTELIAAKAVVIEDYALPVCSGCDRTLHHVRVSGECPGCGTGACGGTCEGCGRFLTAATLQGAVSACCQAPPRLTLTQLPVLKLEEHREQLLEVWSQANIPPRVRQLIAGYLADGLPDIPMAYPSDWGIEWRHGDAQLRIDVWAEMAIGYLFSVARHVEAGRREHSGADVAGFAPSLADCLERWEPVDRVWHFLGIDNAFYYSTMIPALLTAAGVRTDFLGGLLVNEFLHLDGLKFSTSRNHAIWAHEFLADTDPGPLRAYLSWCRPDCHETDFT
ncbi:MAG: class I tRNA ligase family protein, partial [Micromonosporaceae bacterium]